MPAVAPQIIRPHLNDAMKATTATPATKGNLNSNDNTAKAFARIFPGGTPFFGGGTELYFTQFQCVSELSKLARLATDFTCIISSQVGSPENILWDSWPT